MHTPSPQLRRRKAFGQHHLREGSICRPLVDFLRLHAGDSALEIGAGGGVLTRQLLATGADVVALELDPAWAFELARRLRAESLPGALRLVAADALDLVWQALPAGWRVTGNLPYNVGGVLVERFLAAARPGTRAAFLLQREVVDRIVAGPGDPAYGALSVLVASRAAANRLGLVRPGSFVPPPKVDSAFVGLLVSPALLSSDRRGRFERVVRAAFAQRRKAIRNPLATEFGRELAAAALAQAQIDSGRRAEELSLADFVRLERAFALQIAIDEDAETAQ